MTTATIRQTYTKRGTATVFAIKINLALLGGHFQYEKWGGVQTGKSGDWLVQNGDDVYTVDASSFDKTYQEVGPATYRKVAKVYAEQATEAGSIQTKEGATAYAVGDYLVSNNADGSDAYAVEPEKFEAMYERVD